MRASIPRGAYGLSFPGLPDASALVSCPAAWPDVRVDRTPLATEPGPTIVGPGRAELRLVGGGQLVVERDQRRATFRTREPIVDEDLVHPYLAPVGSVFARWLDRPSFHAGAFVTGNGAWALLGAKGDGKSTTLAWLALAGAPILTDDVLVVGNGGALAGPRCIDLRPDACSALGAEARGASRAGSRRRLPLAGLDPEIPLRGFVHLAWGARVEVRALRPPERLLRLAAHDGGSFSGSPETPLGLAALPSLELSRPRRLDVLPEVGARLLELAG